MDTIENKNKAKTLILTILNFPILLIIIGIILINVPTFILRSIAQLLLSAFSVDNKTAIAVVIFCVRLITVYFAYTLFTKIFEKRKADELLFDISTLKEFSLGGLIGLMTITVVIGLMWIMGGYSIVGINYSATVLDSFLYNFFFAFLQDIVYFAIIFRIIEKSLGSIIAVAIASVILGFKHLLFPGYTIWSALAQTIEAGVLFSAFFILTRRIWLLFGFHFMWNFIQTGVIGDPKIRELKSILISNYSGPNIITGEPVGLEASILTFIIGTGLGIYFLYRVYKKGNLVLPFWKR